MSVEMQHFVFNALQENTYILFDSISKESAIIDPGCFDKKEQQALQTFISDKGLKVKYLLNTHCHIDHVLGNSWVSKTYRVSLSISETEKEVLQSVPLYAGYYGYPAYEPYEGPINLISPHTPIQIGGVVCEILSVPGHSPGHVAFYVSSKNWCISGDVLFRSSIGRTDLPGGNFAQLEKSIKQVLYALPAQTVIFPGHGPETTIAFEKENNMYVRV